MKTHFTDSDLPHLLEMIDRISLKKKTEQNGRRLAAFFDFDGSIINGDSCEGLPGSYIGLVDTVFKQLIANALLTQEAAQNFWQKYNQLNETNTVSAYLYLVDFLDVFTPQVKTIMQQIIQEHFEQSLKKHFFSSVIKILEHLSRQNTECFVISGSPHLFLAGIDCFLPIPKENIFGILPPAERKFVHYGQGKLDLLNHIVQQRKNIHGTELFPILGVGNSWPSDGHFLQAIVEKEGIGLLVNPSTDSMGSFGVSEMNQRKIQYSNRLVLLAGRH